MNWTKLTAALTAGHPITGAYNVDDDLAAGEINAINLPGDGTVREVLMYMLSIKHRTSQGTDTTYTPVLGRLQTVAQSATGDDPFGRGAGNELNLVQVCTCRMLLYLISSSHIEKLDFNDANLSLGTVNGAGVISPAQETAIEALSDNKTSVAISESLGYVSGEHVGYARTL